MTFSMAAKTAAVAAISDDITQISLHSDDPGPAGLLNEISGGTPDYERQAPSYTAASGVASLDDTILFDAADVVITHLGLWAGATFYGSFELPAPRTVVGQDVVRVSICDLDLSEDA
jgi:hypothetical protein